MNSPKEEKCCKKCKDVELTGHDVCAFKHCECHPDGRSSPTWEEKEREEFEDAVKDYPDVFQPFIQSIFDYFLERMKAVREEAYHQGIHEGDLEVLKNYNRALRDECSDIVEIIKGVGRSQALEEVREKYEEMDLTLKNKGNWNYELAKFTIWLQGK